jgi:hypothetical protein
MSEDDDRCETCGLPGVECGDYGCAVMGADSYRDEPALPPRAYSLRFPAWGPEWLSLLATCAYLREGILSPDLRLD